MPEFTTPRSSGPIDPGSTIAVGTDWTEVIDANDADAAVKFILQNNSDEDMEIALSDDADAGFILTGDVTGGGVWEESAYAGSVWAKHGGAGDKDLTRIIF